MALCFAISVISGCNTQPQSLTHDVHDLDPHDHSHAHGDHAQQLEPVAPPHTHAVVNTGAGPAVEACVCDQARLTSGWCGTCEVGYVAGLPIGSALLFDTLDAHGHDIDVSTLECELCVQAAATDGFCPQCRMGFVGNQAYFSRLTHYLAGGEAVDPHELHCQECRANNATALNRWCEKCDHGLIGNVVFSDRSEFDNARIQLDLLTVALHEADRCEMCACAIVVNGRCPICRIQYYNGKPIEDS